MAGFGKRPRVLASAFCCFFTGSGSSSGLVLILRDVVQFKGFVSGIGKLVQKAPWILEQIRNCPAGFQRSLASSGKLWESF